MPAWPATLPIAPLLDGYRERPPATTLRTEMDTGPAKLRRRFTSGTRPISVGFVLTKAQLERFDEFYVTVCAGGALSWTWEHPRTLEPVTLRFVELGEYEPITPTQWRVTMQLEVMP